MSEKRLHLYLIPILLLSISTWMVVRGALVGVNLHTNATFVNLEILMGAGFSIVEAFFLVFLTSQLVVTLKSEDQYLKMLRYPLIACILILLLLLPVVGSAPYYAFIMEQTMRETFNPVALYLWILAALTPIPVALAGMGIAWMISKLENQKEERNIYELIDKYDGDPRAISEELNVSLPKAEEMILEATDINRRNGNG